MPSIASLAKLAIGAAILATVAAEPQLVIQQQGDLSTTWGNVHDVLQSSVQGSIEATKKMFGEKIEKAQHAIDDSFKAFTHPAFPEYGMRYKEPSLCDPDVRQISGYLDVDSDKHFFFWFFESRDKPAEDPLVLWLNGGPGCSSLTGLFMELGPCTVNLPGNDTIPNKYSWNNNANVIFLDQPINVGYSYGSGGASNTVAAAKDVNAFLQLFLKEFAEYSHLDFHISGESYAGHYIPAIAGVINRQNNGEYLSASVHAQASTLSTINLKSLLIGNGLTDPLVQYKYYAQMACDNSYGPTLDRSTCDRMEAQYPACARLIENCYKSKSVFACLPAAMKCNKDQIQPYQQTGKNPYDVREDCKGGNLCYDILESVQTYLNREDVKKSVGAQIESYESCNMQINFRFQMAGDWMLPYVNEIAPLLEDKIRILIYAGDADFICNWMGNKAWTLELPWSGQQEFVSAEDEDWISDITGEKAGELRTTKDGLFAFLRVYGAGHMVPYDQPEHGLDMLNGWIRGFR